MSKDLIDVFFIKRFDRESTDQGWSRKGYLSALSFLGIGESEREHYSYLELADRMRQRGLSSDLEELFRRMVFNILCRNTDDHPRNHGFLLRDEKFSQSPAFDITPTPRGEGVSTRPQLAMVVGYLAGRQASLENALSSCSRFGLTSEEAGHIITIITEKCLNTWEESFRLFGVSSQDKAMFNHTFERWGSQYGDPDNSEEFSPSPG